jgi:hypothetical protein
MIIKLYQKQMTIFEIDNNLYLYNIQNIDYLDNKLSIY